MPATTAGHINSMKQGQAATAQPSGGSLSVAQITRDQSDESLEDSVEQLREHLHEHLEGVVEGGCTIDEGVLKKFILEYLKDTQNLDYPTLAKQLAEQLARDGVTGFREVVKRDPVFDYTYKVDSQGRFIGSDGNPVEVMRQKMLKENLDGLAVVDSLLEIQDYFAANPEASHALIVSHDESGSGRNYLNYFVRDGDVIRAYWIEHKGSRESLEGYQAEVIEKFGGSFIAEVSDLVSPLVFNGSSAPSVPELAQLAVDTTELGALSSENYQGRVQVAMDGDRLQAVLNEQQNQIEIVQQAIEKILLEADSLKEGIEYVAEHILEITEKSLEEYYSRIEKAEETGGMEEVGIDLRRMGENQATSLAEVNGIGLENMSMLERAIAQREANLAIQGINQQVGVANVAGTPLGNSNLHFEQQSNISKEGLSSRNGIGVRESAHNHPATNSNYGTTGIKKDREETVLISSGLNGISKAPGIQSSTSIGYSARRRYPAFISDPSAIKTTHVTVLKPLASVMSKLFLGKKTETQEGTKHEDKNENERAKDKFSAALQHVIRQQQYEYIIAHRLQAEMSEIASEERRVAFKDEVEEEVSGLGLNLHTSETTSIERHLEVEEDSQISDSVEDLKSEAGAEVELELELDLKSEEELLELGEGMDGALEDQVLEDSSVSDTQLENAEVVEESAVKVEEPTIELSEVGEVTPRKESDVVFNLNPLEDYLPTGTNGNGVGKVVETVSVEKRSTSSVSLEESKEEALEHNLQAGRQARKITTKHSLDETVFEESVRLNEAKAQVEESEVITKEGRAKLAYNKQASLSNSHTLSNERKENRRREVSHTEHKTSNFSTVKKSNDQALFSVKEDSRTAKRAQKQKLQRKKEMLLNALSAQASFRGIEAALYQQSLMASDSELDYLERLIYLLAKLLGYDMAAIKKMLQELDISPKSLSEIDQIVQEILVQQQGIDGEDEDELLANQ